jgi:heme exporter protein B
MRQRLAFERVLLHAPTILLLDEPFTGLDDESARGMVARLAALRDAGTLVVLATHDLGLVEGLVDRAFVVQHGVLVELERGRSIADAYRAVIGQFGRLGEPSLPSSNGQHALGGEVLAGAREPSLPGDVALRDVVAATTVLVGKDLRIEHRSREGLLTTVFFALSCVLVFSFALVRDGTPTPDAGPAVLWVAIALSGTLAMARTFERERSAGTLAAILVSPAPRPAIFLGKWIALMALMFAVEAILLPLIALFFQMNIGGQPWAILALLAAGTAGYAAIGTLFAAMLARTRTRDVLLPLLLYPMSVPIIIGGVRGTAAALADPYVPGQVSLWLSLLICFDAVFVTLALWTFGTLMTEAAPRVAKEA